MIRLPSDRFGSAAVSATARWTSSMAPVYDVREEASESETRTKMTGQRSLADMYANEVLSDVK
jgi:hypothetical protein